MASVYVRFRFIVLATTVTLSMYNSFERSSFFLAEFFSFFQTASSDPCDGLQLKVKPLGITMFFLEQKKKKEVADSVFSRFSQQIWHKNASLAHYKHEIYPGPGMEFMHANYGN